MPELIVIRLAGQDLVSPVELLEQHDPSELVRERDPPERQARVELLEVEPARAADHEAEVAALLPALLEPAAQLHRVELAAVGRQEDQVRALRDALRHALVLAHLEQLHARVPREELAV